MKPLLVITADTEVNFGKNSDVKISVLHLKILLKNTLLLWNETLYTL